MTGELVCTQQSSSIVCFHLAVHCCPPLLPHNAKPWNTTQSAWLPKQNSKKREKTAEAETDPEIVCRQQSLSVVCCQLVVYHCPTLLPRNVRLCKMTQYARLFSYRLPLPAVRLMSVSMFVSCLVRVIYCGSTSSGCRPVAVTNILGGRQKKKKETNGIKDAVFFDVLSALLSYASQVRR